MASSPRPPASRAAAANPLVVYRRAPAALRAAVALFAALAPAACGADAGSGDSTTRGVPAAGSPEPRQVRFVVEKGLLQRRDPGGRRPILALDSTSAPAGVPSVPGRWSPSPEVRFGIGATSFRHVVPSPDGRRVAWEAGSTHALLGVVPADGGGITVLDFLFDSSARALAWSPSGRYLAVLHMPPGRPPHAAHRAGGGPGVRRRGRGAAPDALGRELPAP